MDAAPALDRHGLLGRFAAPVEAEYQLWLVERLRTLAIVLTTANIPIWLIFPFASVAAVPVVDHSWLIFVDAWGLNLSVAGAVLVYLRRSQPRRIVAVTASVVLLIAVANVATVAFTLPETEPGTYLFGTLVYCMTLLALRTPFRVTVAVNTLITVVGLTGALVGAAGAPSRVLAGPNATLVLVTLMLLPTMALLNEQSVRNTFVSERVIAQQQRLIRRYVPSAVASRIEAGDTTVDHPQRRRVTVFFSDVVGFTTMADRVDPEALAEIVNDYLGSVSELIERHGGTLNEFAGDGVMAIFGAPDQMDPTDQVRAALGAGQELQRSLPEWSQSWYQHGIVEDARARVGINTGIISVGTFGSTVRATYTGIGLQTNIAARVQSEAPPGGILLSNTSWHLIKDSIACEPRGQVMVKGVHFPIELYEPIQ